MKQVSFFYFVLMLGIVIIGCRTSNNLIGDNGDILGCMESSACNYDSKANIPNVCISIQNVDLSTNILEVWMMNNIPVEGFQFNISGVTIISASEGSAQSNGMTQSNSEHIILGFSLSGDAIPPGNGVLTQLVFSESSGLICLSLPVFSDNSGEALLVELGECF